jgi:hypothetical protein
VGGDGEDENHGNGEEKAVHGRSPPPTEARNEPFLLYTDFGVINLAGLVLEVRHLSGEVSALGVEEIAAGAEDADDFVLDHFVLPS